MVSFSGSVLGDAIDANIGGGAGNLGEPYTFDLIDIAEPALTYNGIPTRKGAISVDQTYKTITLGFPFEAITDATDREEVLTAVLEWFGIQGGVDVYENNIVTSQTYLSGNYPNPFNPTTTIKYSLKEDSAVSLVIYNIKGQIVKQLVNGHLSADQYTIVWNGEDDNNYPVSSGIYFYKLKTENYEKTKRMILLK